MQSEPAFRPTCRVASLYLDYGADAQVCDSRTLELSERGMCFQSRWQFEIGTQLAVACVCADARGGSKRVMAEGVVVWCEPRARHCYESTVLFLELPDELKQSLREFSHQLAPAGAA